MLEINPENISEDSAFYLGVNALTYDKTELAYDFFKKAAQSFKSQSNKDNAIFWMWLIKNNEEDLKTLSQSSSLNIYSLYAKELTNTPFPKIESLNPSKKKIILICKILLLGKK